MSEVLVQLEKKGGGGISGGVSLWTNPSPTNDFAAQDVTLSAPISNYRYIKIKYASKKNQTTTPSSIAELILSIEDIQKSIPRANASMPETPIIGLGCDTINKSIYMRVMLYISPSVLHFEPARYLGGNSTVYDVCIPLEIFGVN